MWDDTLADPNWTRKLPFSNDAFTYINVKKSPLKSQLIKVVYPPRSTPLGLPP